MRFCILLAICALGVASCKKDDSSSGSTVKYKVKTYTEDVTGAAYGHKKVVYNLTYDANDRIVSMVSESDPGFKFVYDYVNDNRAEVSVYTNGEVDIRQIFFLNSASLVDSTVQFNSEGDTTSEKYTYNGNKQLIKINEYTVSNGISYRSDETTYTYDDAGNQLTDKNDERTITHFYETPVLNTCITTPAMLPVAKQLPTRDLLYVDGDTYEAVHTYTYDDQKRVISHTGFISEDEMGTKSYTYF